MISAGIVAIKITAPDGSLGREHRRANAVFTVRVPVTFCLPEELNGLVFHFGLTVA